MSVHVLYIDVAYLKKNTNLSSNIDDNTIFPNLRKAQDIYITPFLGSVLDAQLKDHITNNTVTQLEKDLITLLRKSQAEFTAYLTYVDVLFKWMNKSATSPSVENGTNISRNDLSYVRDISKDQGEFFLERARVFLCENKTTFPSKNWDNSKTYVSPIDCEFVPKENLYGNNNGYNFS